MHCRNCRKCSPVVGSNRFKNQDKNKCWLKKLIELGQKHYNVYQILSWHNILGTTDLEFYDSSFKRPRRYAKKSQSNDNKNVALDPSMVSRFALQNKWKGKVEKNCICF